LTVCSGPVSFSFTLYVKSHVYKLQKSEINLTSPQDSGNFSWDCRFRGEKLCDGRPFLQTYLQHRDRKAKYSHSNEIYKVRLIPSSRDILLIPNRLYISNLGTDFDLNHRQFIANVVLSTFVQVHSAVFPLGFIIVIFSATIF
jgi:hypothetical protein